MKLRVVVIEAQNYILDIISTMLQLRGHEVLGFREPSICHLYSDGTCSCPKESPCADILIVDNEMPTMSGLEFILQQSNRGCKGAFRNKAVLAGTWAPRDVALADSLQCKIFRKPIQTKELFEWIKDCEERISQERLNLG